MKVLIVGADFAACTLAVTVRRNVPTALITMLPLNDEIALGNCAGPSIEAGKCSREQAMIIEPQLLAKWGILVEERSDLRQIDLKARTVKTIKREYDADFLVLVFPSIPARQFSWEPANCFREIFKKRVAVIGAGAYGCQMASDLVENNTVTLFGKEKYPCEEYFDLEFEMKIKELLCQEKIEFISEAVESVKNGEITTKSGIYKCDTYVNATGLKPDPRFVQLVQSELLVEDGYIQVDDECKPDVANIFCIGISASACVNSQNPSDDLFLRQALCVASQIAGLTKLRLESETRCMVLKIAEKCIISVGKPAYKLECERVRVTDNHRAEFMETYEVISLELNYNDTNRLVLGCECYSGKDVQWLANSVSMAVQKGMTVEHLLVCDFFFQPHFGKPWNIINLACMATHGLPPFEEYKLRQDGEDEIV